MLHPTRNWIAVADGRRAALFSCRTLPGGRFHLDEASSIENDWENSHEHHRPTLIGGAERRGAVGRSGASAALHSSAPGHEDQEEQLRFARQVSTWLTHAVRSEEAGRVSVFAVPQFLGLLRHQFGHGNPQLELHEGELANLRAGELEKHPAIIDALARARP